MRRTSARISFTGAKARWLTCTCRAWNDGWISRAEPTANCAVTTSMPWRRLVIDGERYIYRGSSVVSKLDVIQAPEMHYGFSRTPARVSYFVFHRRAHYSPFPRWIARYHLSSFPPSFFRLIFFLLFRPAQFVSSPWADQVAAGVNLNFKDDVSGKPFAQDRDKVRCCVFWSWSNV